MLGAGGLLKTGGQVIGLAGQMLNQRDTLRDLKAAQANLKGVQDQGVTSTLTPEMRDAMTLSMKNYTAAQERSKYGFAPEEAAAYKSAIDRNQTQQIAAAGEAGGGQMASYVGALSSANKADNFLDMMSKDATMKLQKEQFAANQLNPVIQMAGGIQDVAGSDRNRYDALLSSAGKAVSDLRMQKAANREGIYNTAGTAVYSKGAEKEENMKQAAKIAMSVFGGPAGAMASSAIPSGGGAQAPQIGSSQNTTYGSFSDYGTQIG
jgi:hypothetical protein